ncbi:toll/interleukin-1 receptor domain-containing protein [Actinosynnema sp. CS-041913]|uniref:toll/interleukin-1 receptor domain-containing protein n=1 Tax=Actinosynnema sp. CS-041913 TaxID=3239917 RepID=UPI003D8CEEC0
MADLDAIRLLTEGVAGWNAGRAGLRRPVDLTHVRIRNATLPGIDLRDVDLNGAVLERVDLRGARLSGALVNGVTAEDVLLDRSELAGAELKGSDFKWVALRHASLRGVFARQSRIRFSSLRAADLSRATLDGVHVYNSDLTDAVVAGAVVVPPVFLRRVAAEPGGLDRFRALGCDIEEAYRPLEHEWHDFDGLRIATDGEDHDLVEHDSRVFPISAGRYDFFVSHASADTDDVAAPLAAALRAEGFRVWIDQRFVAPRDDLATVIGFGIRSSRYGIVVLSERYFGRRWTELEYEALARAEVFLVLHGVSPEKLEEIRPGLSDRVAVSSALGAGGMARVIAESVRRPRHHLFGRLGDDRP